MTIQRLGGAHFKSFGSYKMLQSFIVGLGLLSLAGVIMVARNPVLPKGGTLNLL